MMLTILSTMFFLLGLIWGSFINMAVYRVKHELSFSGRSFCDYTKKQLIWKDLVPVFSYLFYKSRCRHCGKTLPALYPIVEIITGLTFVIGFNYLLTLDSTGIIFTINTLIVVMLVLLFIFFAAYDYLYWEVNVKAIQVALIFAFVFTLLSVVFPQLVLEGWSSLLAGLIAGGLIFLVVRFTKGSGIGEGDIYLMALAGIVTGLAGLLPLFLISTVSGSIIGIIKAIKIKKFHGVKIQFVPFISFAALTVFFYKDTILEFLNLESISFIFN